MKKLALLALGALAVTGCDFVGGDAVGVALPISSIQATGLPAGADATPDIFVEIQNAVGQTIWRSETQIDYTDSALSISVPASVEVAAATQALSVSVWDYGTSYTDSQLMARSAGFTADQLATQAEIGLGSFDSRGRALETSFTVSAR